MELQDEVEGFLFRCWGTGRGEEFCLDTILLGRGDEVFLSPWCGEFLLLLLDPFDFTVLGEKFWELLKFWLFCWYVFDVLWEDVEDDLVCAWLVAMTVVLALGPRLDELYPTMLQV